MRNRLMLWTACALAAAVALVQAQPAQQHNDHDQHMEKGGGSIPAGWSARLDNGSTKAEGVRFTPMGSGVHFISGPAGIYWKPEMRKSGSYEVSATFTLMEPSEHPEGYGLIFGGSDLAGAAQKYTYFLVRQDGRFLIKRRNGTSTPTVTDWTANAAIVKTAGDTQGENRLTVAVTPDTVRFLVNGKEVGTAAASQVDTNGLVGLRVNHNLNVHVEGFGVK